MRMKLLIASSAIALGGALTFSTPALAQATCDLTLLGDGGATAADATDFACGPGAVADGEVGAGATAIGDTVTATGDGAVAVGDDANAAGSGAIAIGGDLSADAAVDTGAQAVGVGAIAIGAGAAATADGAVAIGDGAQAAFVDSVAIGAGTVTDADNQVNVGGRTIEGVLAVAPVAGGDAVATTGQLFTTNTAVDANTAGIAAAAAVNATQATQITAITTVNTTQATQITALQAADVALGNRVTTLEDLAVDFADDLDNIDDRASSGTSTAIAMGGAMFLPDKAVNLTGNVGYYRGSWAGALNLGALVGDGAAFNAGIGKGINRNGKIGARAGFTVGW
jgi:hypothetical protein